jgi:hypothetical protein
MTDKEIDKIIFDTIPAPLEAGIDEMRSLVLAGMRAEREALVPAHELSNYRIARKAHTNTSSPKAWQRAVNNAMRLAEAIDRREAAAIRKRGEG